MTHLQVNYLEVIHLRVNHIKAIRLKVNHYEVIHLMVNHFVLKWCPLRQTKGNVLADVWKSEIQPERSNTRHQELRR